MYNPNVEKVTLMTMHAAKGLEFPVVFISGCENQFIPYTDHKNKPVDVNEERRLFYVAMTRAKEHLFLSWAKKRKIYGKTHERKLSPFVDEIEKQLLTYESSYQKKKIKKSQTQLKLF